MNKCHICNADAAFTCRQCGKPVCGAHYSFDNGKCAECNGTVKKTETGYVEAKFSPEVVKLHYPDTGEPKIGKVTKRQKARK